MNSEVIKTPTFINAFKSFWPSWRARKSYFADIQTWWDIAKLKIKELARETSKIEAIDKREAETRLNIAIDKLHSRNPDDPELEVLREQQKKFMKRKQRAQKSDHERNGMKKVKNPRDTFILWKKNMAVIRRGIK